MMDFRKITYFLKTAEKLNFTEAARELFISPQALTQQIAQLEADLGTPLFVRTTRKMTLTEAGLFCYQKFAPAVASYHTAEQEVRWELSRRCSLLRVGFFHGLPKRTVVNPWLKLIQAYSPGTELEIISTDLDSIWKYMDEGRLDLCLTNVDDSFSASAYHTISMLQAPAEIIVSLNHPWALKDTVTPADISSGNMVQLHSTHSHQKENFYSRVQCRKICQVTDFDTLLATLENSCTFAVCPPTFEYHDQGGYKFFPLPEEFQFTFFTICAAVRHHPVLNLKKMLEYLAENY